MAGSPAYKVYDARGVYQAAVKEIEAGAVLMGLYGHGATIRWGHNKGAIVWTEGAEDQEAAESYDHVAEIVGGRVDARNRASYARAYGAPCAYLTPRGACGIPQSSHAGQVRSGGMAASHSWTAA